MKKLLFLLLFVFAQSFAFSQLFPGYNNSNYAGVSGIDLQPASIADSRFKVDINLVGMEFMFNNNYIGFLGSPTYLLSQAKKESKDSLNVTIFDDSDFQTNHLYERQSSYDKSVYLNLDLQGPSAMVVLGPKASGAFTSRLRSILNVDGVNADLATQIWNSLEDESFWKNNYENKNLSVQSMVWLEYGLSYSRVVYDENEHFIKAGGRLKLLQGVLSAYMFVDNFKYSFYNDDTLTIFNTDANYGHSDNFEFDSESAKFKFKSKPTVGLDIGAVYEYRPDYEEYKYDMDGQTDLWRKDKNKYKFKAGFSLMDLGRLNFQKGEYSQNFNADIVLWNIDTLDFTGVADFDTMLDTRFNWEEENGAYKMNLPAALSFQFDYNIWKDFYINFTPFFAFKMKKDRHKVHQINMYSLTPRWDHKWFGVFLPISYNGFRNTNIGLSLRAGPIIVGTRSLGSLGSGKTYGFDIHVALKVPIPYGPPKDRDKDKVSDKMDKCIEVPGVWEFLGCPDIDGDHIQDSEDLCPTIPGLQEFQGCPDTDGDGIGDLDDDCVEVPGIPEFKGCPDTDGDGIKDSEDECPDVPGPKEFNGCPDTDGDGITDGKDECPTVPGIPELFGCPETKLHLVDGNLRVLQTATRNEDGFFVFKNLPLDKPYFFLIEGDDSFLSDELLVLFMNPEGVEVIKAVKVVGKGFNYQYLPPEPEVIEIIEEEDVIIILEEEQEIINTAFDNLEFNTGRAVIRSVSYASLVELAELLKKKPEWKLKLTGHTDDVGAELSNLSLSKRRSEAVKTFLVENGIASENVIVRYFGELEPIAPNDTEEGRQKNRRVEMEIVQ